MPEPFLDQKLLKRLLVYDPDTGQFTWLRRSGGQKSWNTRYSGRVAGCDWSPDGKTIYRAIRIFDWPFTAHRRAVLFMTGAWPANEVDHKDRCGTNNRWKNLRQATKAQNGANRGANKNNKTGIKGVTLSQGRYKATIQSNGKSKFLGRFDSAAEAGAAYQTAAAQMQGAFAKST